MATQQRCAACSSKIITSFAAACGARIRPSIPLARCIQLRTPALSARSFHRTGSRLDTATHPEVPSKTLAETPKDVLPWFLRVETPKAPRHPLAEKQKLPDLPEDPPPELADMLNHLSEAHGITCLNILDLRPLDPPPAIGSVVMLVGTARSIRHLHATADKICRYMRSEYKWTPYADGLLGRNELRLINRRKRRRGKVVSTQMGELEEAGSSAWVCVNGSNQALVVQLFTEGKREEMDIDGLWCEILDRNERHRIAEARRQAERERKWAEDAAKTVQTSEAIEDDVHIKPGGGQEETIPAMEMAAEVKEMERAEVEANDAIRDEALLGDTVQEITVDVDTVKVNDEANQVGPVQIKEEVLKGVDGTAQMPQAADSVPPPEDIMTTIAVELEEEIEGTALGAFQVGEGIADAGEDIQAREAEGLARELALLEGEQSLREREDTKEEAANSVQQAEQIPSLRIYYNTLPSVSGPKTQTRHLHQQAATAQPRRADVAISDYPTFPEFVRTGDLNGLLQTLPISTPETVLKAHIDALQSSLVTPQSLVGTGFSDHTSTPFLRTFYAALSSAGPVTAVKFELALLLCSNTHKPDLYPVSSFLPFFQGLRAQEKPLQTEHYYLLLSHLAICPELRPTENTDWTALVDARVALMDLFLHDFKALLSAEEASSISDRPEFRYAFFLAHVREPLPAARAALLASPTTRPAGQFTLHPTIHRGTHQLASLSADTTYRYTLRQHHLDYLVALGLGQKWAKLWNWWKRLPLHGVTRDAEYYKLAYSLVALGENQREALYCLRWAGADSLLREVPRVSLRNPDLAARLLRLCELADPGAQSSEWGELRTACERAVNDGDRGVI